MLPFRSYDVDQDLSEVECWRDNRLQSTCISCKGMTETPKYLNLGSTNDCMRDIYALPQQMYELQLGIEISNCEDDDLFNVEYLKKMLSDLETKVVQFFTLIIHCNEYEDWPTLRKKLIKLFTNLPTPEIPDDGRIYIDVRGDRVNPKSIDLDLEDMHYLSLKEDAARNKTIGDKLLSTL